MYGKETYSYVDKLRYNKVRQSFKGRPSILSSSDGVDLSQMPPCDQVLQLHISRAIFQTLVWRNSHVQFFYLPDPTENGWTVSPSGGLAIQWFSDNFLPRDQQDILSEVDVHKDGVWEDDSERKLQSQTLILLQVMKTARIQRRNYS